MAQTFYSNGKLFLAGEYVVLDGANALGLPTIYGQYLDVVPVEGDTIKWKSIDHDGSIWYEDEIDLRDIYANRDNQTPETAILIKILHVAQVLNPLVLTQGYIVKTRLTFPRHWGLGSSSTLINNVAQWFGIDPYRLLWQSFGGSGYDIACARHNTPVIFRKAGGMPVEEPVTFRPAFAGNLWFVYLNRKQNSRVAIENYRGRKNDNAALIKAINDITAKMLASKDLDEFMACMEEHENVLSPALGIPPVKQTLFADFGGAVKSLGGWGGDFILAASPDDPQSYFYSRGYHTVIPYSQMILK